MHRRSRSRNLKNENSRGQTLVEFALVFLVFMTIFTGILEFGIGFAVKMQMSFASRDAAVTASESGGTPNTADGAILNAIDKDITTPASRSQIDHVDIFWALPDGTENLAYIERYTPGGALYTGWGGWTRALDTYPAANRCAFISGVAAGCLTGHSGPDTIGVMIVYRYTWMTPLPNLIGLAGSGFTFTQTNLTTMEPIPTT
jgi:hypothetical protein